MAFTLVEVVPWGRSFDEYRGMFALGEDDLARTVLGCGDGPAAFNAELTRRGGRCISVDPLYQFAAEDIRRRIDETAGVVLKQTRKNHTEFVWKNIASPDELYEIRMAAMDEFLADYPAGRLQGRYVPAQLPQLPFLSREFELALCSHFLFLYSQQYPLEFHLQAVRELCRVADEVRIFPLLSLGAVESPHLSPLLAALGDEGYACEVRRVDYEFQKGGDRMLVVRRG